MNLREVFESEVPAGFLKDAVHGVIAAYEESYGHCIASFPMETGSWRLHGAARDLLPIERRACIERNLKAAAVRYPLMTATTELNSVRNSSHTYIRSGLVALTASATASADAMVRYAEFRSTRARSNQSYLFFIDNPAPADSDPLYALLIHGPDEIDPSRPAFIRVVFPDPDLTQYLDDIDLLDKFGDGSGVPIITDVESIDDDLGIRIKKSADRKKREA